MSCFYSGDKWKREQVPDHKFDYVNIDEYKHEGWLNKFGYSFVFIMTFKSVAVAMADIYTVMIIVLDKWSVATTEQMAAANLPAKFEFLGPQGYKTLLNSFPWIYSGSILVSFLLLAVESRKARKIIKSRDISFAFTDLIAYRYYCLRSYGHWCFFNRIRSQQKFRDQLTQFVFFRLKGWTSLLFAETPRQAINFLILYIQFSVLSHITAGTTTNTGSFDTNRIIANMRVQLPQQSIGLGAMTFVILIYFINAGTTILAAFMYIPLLCRIRGNLKEYVCHMIDKRIGQLMQRKVLKRMQAREKQVAKYGYAMEDPSIPRAELPNFSTLNDPRFTPVSYSRVPNPSNYPASYSSSVRSSPSTTFSTFNSNNGSFYGSNSSVFAASQSPLHSSVYPTATSGQSHQYYKR